MKEARAAGVLRNLAQIFAAVNGVKENMAKAWPIQLIDETEDPLTGAEMKDILNKLKPRDNGKPG